MAIRLTAYEGVKIQQNHYIEYIDIYLLDHESTVLKETTILSKDFDSDEDAFTIKITNQGDNSDILNVNYVKLIDIDTRYYFVTGAKRLSNDIWQLSLVLDVVNTYRDDILFANNFKQVSIKRRHKDRWKLNNTTKNYERVFDKVDEGFNELATQIEVTREINTDDIYLVTKELSGTVGNSYYSYGDKLLTTLCFNDSTKIKAMHYSWTKTSFDTTRYLIIPRSSNDLVRVTIGNSLLSVVADAMFIVPSANSVTLIPMHKDGDNYTYLASHNVYVSEVTKGYLIEVEGTSNFDVYTTTYTYVAIDSVVHKFSEMQAAYYTECDSSTTLRIVSAISELNRSDNKVKAIINVPVESSPEYIYFNEMIIIPNDKIISSEKNLDISSDNVLSKINKVVRERNINYESKLYGSYVRKHYIAYDAFKLPAMPEYLNDLSNLKITTYVPNDMTTNIMIMSDTIEQTGYKGNVLMCSRNNNLSLFSNSYLDYIRNGYNYDQKNQTISNISNWVNFGSSIVGTGIGINKAKDNAFMASNVLSMGINAVTSLGSSIMSSIQNERSLLNKRNQILNSSVSMSGSDNVLLFKEVNYGYNLIEYVVEAPNSELLNSIWNLFYFTGYADNLYYETMPKIKTRAYFNYVQADIYQCSITNAKARNRIIAAYGAGITFEWQYNNTWLCEGTLYENWEESI